MSRLKAALIREYEDDAEYDIEVHNPGNTKSVELYFRGEKMAKVRRMLARKVARFYINGPFQHFIFEYLSIIVL